MNKDDTDHPHQYLPPPASPTPAAGLFGKGKYKLWVLAAILLLAFCSMLTGSVTLKWSAGNLTRLSDRLFDTPLFRDLDILELEEREKVVKHMWDVYVHSSSTGTRLPRFWQEAFHAAYDSLTSEVPSVRDAAVSEIAMLSLDPTLLSSPSQADDPSDSDPHQSSAEKMRDLS